LKYITQLYGLTFSSEFQLSDMPFEKSKKLADVAVIKGKITRPKDGKKGYYYKPFSVISRDSYFLEVPNIARFKLTKNKIIIHKLRKASWQDVFAFFYDTVLIIILMMNDKFVFHASAIAIDKKAYLFCASPGGGKSLLAAAFMKNKNAKIIEDDKCLVEYNKRRKRYEIKNWYPFMELWRPDLIHIKGNNKINALTRIRKNIQKIKIDISQAVPKRAMPIEKLILVQIGNEETKVEKSEIKGFSKSKILLQFMQFENFIKVFEKSSAQFKFISSFVNQVSISHVMRSRKTKADEFIKFIDEEIL